MEVLLVILLVMYSLSVIGGLMMLANRTYPRQVTRKSDAWSVATAAVLVAAVVAALVA